MQIDIYLVRHGETDWNKVGRFQGWTDIPLNELGIKQAENLQDYFKNIPLEAVFSSDSIRAIETAKLITKNQSSLKNIQDQRLREIFCGAWEGLTHQEIEQSGDNLEGYFLDPINNPPRDGETIEQLSKRIENFFADIFSNNDFDNKKILIVSHGGTIRAIISMLLKNTAELYSNLYIQNCGVAEIRIENNGRRRLYALNQLG
jgi:broad specificity phosphatase PhoE